MTDPTGESSLHLQMSAWSRDHVIYIDSNENEKWKRCVCKCVKTLKFYTVFFFYIAARVILINAAVI